MKLLLVIVVVYLYYHHFLLLLHHHHLVVFVGVVYVFLPMQHHVLIFVTRQHYVYWLLHRCNFVDLDYLKVVPVDCFHHHHLIFAIFHHLLLLLNHVPSFVAAAAVFLDPAVVEIVLLGFVYHYMILLDFVLYLIEVAAFLDRNEVVLQPHLNRFDEQHVDFLGGQRLRSWLDLFESN